MFDSVQTAVKRGAEHAIQHYFSQEFRPKRDEVDDVPDHKEDGNGAGDEQRDDYKVVENV